MTKRIAISLPDELFRSVERVRKRRRVARSALIQEAVGDYIDRNDEKAREEAYFESYRRMPEGSDGDLDVAALERLALDSLKRARLR